MARGFSTIRRILPIAMMTGTLFFLSGCREQNTALQDSTVQTPKTALAQLMAGNKRFVNETPVHPHQTHARILETEGNQHPFAVVVTCSDSRVPPEIIFDEGIGDLFVIRTAGNLLGDLELGSIEYAVEHLGASLVVVLGHTECGAVKAFLEGGEACGHIKNIVETLAQEPEEQQILSRKGRNLGACIEGNILHGVAQIRQDEPVLTHKIREGKLDVVPMLYDVHTGKVTALE